MLRVLAGDVERLAAPGLNERLATGLRRRIEGALGVMPLVARRYLQSDGAVEAETLARIEAARRAYRAGNLKRLSATVAGLVRRFPLRTRGLMPADVTAGQVRIAAGLYRATCLGCHRFYNTASTRPATDLFAAARRMPPAEFLARMIDGVHGTAYVGFSNPLSQAEIAALYAYFARTPEPRENAAGFRPGAL